MVRTIHQRIAVNVLLAFCVHHLSSSHFVAMAKDSSPNIILINADDLGYGDLSCYGAKKWKTPRLDRLAAEGIRFTNFLVSQPVCSASRASLLTGCYSNRIGINGALMPTAKIGIDDDETTIAELLKQKGYRTGMVGKWHLGHHDRFLPTRHGFDSYLGLPYSNDMWPHGVAKPGKFPPLPMFNNEQVIDADVAPEDQTKLTQRYLDRSIEFIRTESDKPFFLYFAHSFPHVPLYAGKSHVGRSNEGGLYGDVIEEFDSAIGTILDELDNQKIASNTLVVFTSDNGPWLIYGNHSGEAGGLREGKGTVFEGGIRVPLIARWPGKIPAGTTQNEPCMTIDILPTLATITSAALPKLSIDGKDISPLLTALPNARSPQEAYYLYYGNNELRGIRAGNWKMLLPQIARVIEGGKIGNDGQPGTYANLKIERPLLFDLSKDPSEESDLASLEPEKLSQMMRLAEAARADLGDSLTKQNGSGRREPGSIEQ